ncbi:hypothetical protein HBI56_172140 [Parastagonospora nodorum]|uniref:Uncharacterized protein n=1 Tax=Phaeosphaeria nodorum (strain SN15 / ATCC MYA-4574 / FGSC 10173) TaxID=321614 RepID=A0A7U2F5X5_PHANO|nr:hypothetical protein HBH56_220870 [Parastagonospora nodorum]QRC97129.1 hypothetical protein JI435_434590 [Parastagonospora nodorum SN15]KAH3924053.1 hypothetical protein HBH54_200860 [Parastagonospora nodorum]KAH3944678.1 hypothetical protein HBH53_157230 [Parastagonospora nodorum]KAH3964805.1 hypothetical protein HBH52_208490 [Parastagonospora nodorum]
MNFGDVRKAILDAGFDPNARCHSPLYKSQNSSLLEALSGIEVSFIALTVRDNFQLHEGVNDFTCLQTINIHHLAAHMLGSHLKLGSALIAVYQALFGLEDIEAHKAPCDTIMMLDLIRVVAACGHTQN